jgi:hypothetical protein
VRLVEGLADHVAPPVGDLVRVSHAVVIVERAVLGDAIVARVPRLDEACRARCQSRENVFREKAEDRRVSQVRASIWYTQSFTESTTIT